MLSSLLFSSTAVYADTADDDTSLQEVVETGNTSNDTNSSTNQNDTVSGNDTIDNSSNTTTEENQAEEETEKLEVEETETEDTISVDLTATDSEAAESDFNIGDALRESKLLNFRGFLYGDDDDEECEHKNLDSEDVEYFHSSDNEHEIYYKCKDCDEYVSSGKTEACSSSELAYTHLDADSHTVSGVCEKCNTELSYSEDCDFKPVEGNEKLQYCSKDGCNNVKDEREKTPEISIEAALVNGDASKDVETITEDDIVYTAFDKQMKITATVTTEALNDETFDDIAENISATLYLDGESNQAMELESFDKGVAVFTWTSKEQYEDSVSIEALEVNYKIGEKLKDESRSSEVFKSGSGAKDLYYVLRNINTDKAVSNLQCTVTDGNGWKMDENHQWYSKNVEGHSDELILTWTGITGKNIDVDSVQVNEIDKDGNVVSTEGINKVKVESERKWTVEQGRIFYIIPTFSFKLKYANTIQYTVPAEDDGNDGVEHIYEVKFTINGKQHSKQISTYVDNHAPKLNKPVYTSEAKKLNGKYYNKAVNVSLDFTDANISPQSYIEVSGAKANDSMSSGSISLQVTEDGEHTLTGEIYDLAGNCTKLNDSDNSFIIDTQAPEIKNISYKSDASRLNGKYYNKDVTVEVSVEDKYLDTKSHVEVSKNNKVTLAKDVKTSGTFEIPVKEEGEYSLTGEIYDLAGNCTTISDVDNEFIIDKTAPVVDIKFDNNSAKNEKYYNAYRTAEITVTEKYFSDKGVTVEKDENGYDDVPALQEFTNSGLKNVSKIHFDKDGHYGFSIVVEDLAGNKSEVCKVNDFVIDTVAPTLSIKFDNHDAKHEKYYKANRTATFTFEDKNIDGKEANMSNVKLTSKDGKATINEMSGSDGKYTGSIVFDQDGIYQISGLTFEDKAGNKFVFAEDNESDYNAEFVIDKTAPVVDVNFDNNSALNGNYYKDARTAEIIFNEKNFTSEQVTIKKNSGDLNSVPNVGGYSKSDNKNITHIKFDQDGRYGFAVSCEDLAGNVSNVFVTDDFVIDMTLPELEITGVVDMSANNGRVVPVIRSKDANLTDACTEITLTGSNRGKVAPSMTKTKGEENFTYELADLAHEKSNDDLYTLAVKLTDLAGNSVEKKIQYSVNRFGSVFVLSDATKAMVDGYYVTSPQDVVITEINVDSLTQKDVSVTFDGTVNELREGASFTTSDKTNSNGWHSISYNVGKANFNKDGIYSVAIFSEDRATNRQSNQSKDAEVEFLLDKNAPSVIVSGLEDAGIYEEESHDFSINATDTIGVADMKVYLNGEKLASYTSSELNQNGGTAVLTIPTKDDYQQVIIECSDVAGNVTKLAYNNILVSVKAEELLLEDELTPTAKLELDDQAKIAFRKYSSKLIILAIFIVIAIASGVGYATYKKKKN